MFHGIDGYLAKIHYFCTTKPTNAEMNKKNKRIAANVIGLVCTFLMMAAAAMMMNGRLLGHALQAPAEVEAEAVATSEVSHGDTIFINTTEAGKDITGYSGPTPLKIAIVDGRIVSVTALPNSETPGFFGRVEKSGLLDSWNGLTPKEAAAKQVDGVTGATFSSQAVIANVRAGIQPLVDAEDTLTDADSSSSPSASQIAAIIVLIAAMSLPLFIKNKKYRIVQQILNTAILGFWAGTFVDYTMMLNVIGNSPTAWATVVTVLMLIAAFIYPLLGKDGYYCAWVCPLGSLQELASRCNPNHRLKLGNKTIKVLTTLRMILWGALMLCLWTGLWMSWIDYELFTAFIVESAATGVIIAAALMVVISIFIPRPYCRFICPTGTLLRMAQNLKNK